MRTKNQTWGVRASSIAAPLRLELSPQTHPTLHRSVKVQITNSPHQNFYCVTNVVLQILVSCVLRPSYLL